MSTTANAATKYEPGLSFLSVNTNLLITYMLPSVPVKNMNAYSTSWFISFVLYVERTNHILEGFGLTKNKVSRIYKCQKIQMWTFYIANIFQENLATEGGHHIPNMPLTFERNKRYKHNEKL